MTARIMPVEEVRRWEDIGCVVLVLSHEQLRANLAAAEEERDMWRALALERGSALRKAADPYVDASDPEQAMRLMSERMIFLKGPT